ncbi:type II secretion system F family protein [Salinirubellus sp. GCM10025818]|uniref:type II secretion system F family protein n=1 Tax=Salinirubellus TaxID=2162630 RepID=UPI0030CD648B
MSNESGSRFGGSGPDGDDRVPVPEYESEQYFPREWDVTRARKRVLREKFGYIRAYFKSHSDEYVGLQRRLNQGRFGTTYDLYLTRTVTYAALAGLFGLLFGLLLTWVLSTFGVFEALAPESPVPMSSGIAGFLSENRAPIAGAVIASVTSVFAVVAAWAARYYHPSYVVDSRRRNIDLMLPHAIVYGYALSFGGMEFVEVARRMADAEDTYGEVANEFDMVVRDIDLFGNDVFTALRNARNLTPSDNMEQFLDDLLSVLDSGGDVTNFLRDESDKYMDRAMSEQESFLETLATLSELFIVGFVAAPLFLVVTLIMMSFLGAQTVVPLLAVVYAVVPLGMAGFLVVIATLSEPYREPGHDLDVTELAGGEASDVVRAHPHFETFQRIRRRSEISEFFSDPVAVFRREPLYTLGLTVPGALALAGLVIVAGLATPTPDAIVADPFRTTSLLFVLPFLVVTLPLTAFHEYEQGRKRTVTRRLPDALDILASANQMGIQLTEGLGLVARNLSGSFAEELRMVRNDIEWNNDIRRALLSLAGRLEVPQLTRTCKIVAEGSRSTGDLHRVLGTAAEDTRHRYRLERDRRQKLNSYTAIVVMGFLVYLAVIVIIDKSFLGPVVTQAAAAGEGTSNNPVQLSRSSIDLYHTVFFHSALVQSVGTGLITGKLANDSVLSGLKYSIALAVFALLVFAFV